ncbi:hypothetical protein AB0F72_08995 [Actinoplanes sp. NPDC023936]|uniref:hypothetical protein n=1 Tax=Actinoplanes sp. NPDC023936 TaxID=3154910 RepID=UPI0033D660E4
MGSGIKTFADGDILLAADVNNYLMRQSVVTCTSGTRPASPTTGQPIYETDTKLIRVWDGSTWYCPVSPDYVDWSTSVRFYSNANSGTQIATGSVDVTYCRYQKNNKTVHYYGHATINATTASGFAILMPFATGQRIFTLSNVTLYGSSATYDTLRGDGHTPAMSAPYNRFGPVTKTSAQGNIATSGDTVHWNVVYESV